MKNYHVPKRQNWNGNKYLQFKRNEEKLVTRLDKKLSYVPDIVKLNSIGRCFTFK
jgi:hypothetical protein